MAFNAGVRPLGSELGEFLGSASHNKPAPEQPCLPRRKTNNQRSSPDQPPASGSHGSAWESGTCRSTRSTQESTENGTETPHALMHSPTVIPGAGEGLWCHPLLKSPPLGPLWLLLAPHED